MPPNTRMHLTEPRRRWLNIARESPAALQVIRRTLGGKSAPPRETHASYIKWLLAFSYIAVVALLAAAEAQLASRVYRIGYLSYFGCSDGPFLSGPFRQGLGELGYIEGRNIVIECRDAAGKFDRYHDLVAELIRLNVDVLVTASTALALAAKEATRTLPIVIVYVGDPVGSGLVGSLARPGANVTGLSMLAAEMVQKSLELLKETAPSISRVTMLIDSSNPGQTLPDQQMAAAAKILGVRPQRVELRTSADLDAAFAAVLRQRAEAMVVYPLPITPRDSERLGDFAAKHRVTYGNLPPALRQSRTAVFLRDRYRESISARWHLYRQDSERCQAG